MAALGVGGDEGLGDLGQPFLEADVGGHRQTLGGAAALRPGLIVDRRSGPVNEAALVLRRG